MTAAGQAEGGNPAAGPVGQRDATLVYFGCLVIAVVILTVDKTRDYSVDVIQTLLATLVGFRLGTLKGDHEQARKGLRAPARRR